MGVNDVFSQGITQCRLGGGTDDKGKPVRGNCRFAMKSPSGSIFCVKLGEAILTDDLKDCPRPHSRKRDKGPEQVDWVGHIDTPQKAT